MQGMNNPLIKNRYKVIREIGKGGTGIVYLVQDTLKDNLHFALKTIKHGILKRFGIKSMDTFKNEYEIMTRLKHPNLTQVYEFGTENNNCYIVQEYLKGSLLSETRADQDRIIDIIIQILRVLEYIHSRNLVYRDIKPANIMMIEDKVKLMDFGLCRCISQTDAKVSGSFAYMSPESLNAVLTVSMDIFSLGICFFELLTKSRFYIDEKFTVNNILLLLKNHDEFRRYQERRLKTVRGESIRKIIAKMIHFDIRQRYKNCAEIIFDINKKLNCSYEYETKETSQSYVLGNEFANRKTELKVLKNNISDGDKFLAYSGSSGIGKTRMFFEFKKHCILNDILFFEAKCMESETKNYHAIKSILFQIIVLASDKLLPVYGRHLKLIFERHIRLMDYKPTEIVNDPKLLQEIIVQNMSDFIIDFSKEESRSIIVYFDDYQWIDHGSELIINNLLNRMETENISNLSFYANINESKIPSERNIMSIFSKKGAKKYDLAPLDDAGFSEYINNIFGPEYIDKSIEKAIPYLRRSVGGNPFFMQELIRSFIEKGIIIKDKCFWKMLKTFKTSDVPKNIMDIIKTRIETLFRDDDKRKILKVLSLFRIDIDINTIKSIINKIALVDSVKVLLELEYLEVLKFIEIDNIVYVSFANNLIKNHIRDSIDNKGEISIFLADTLEELGLSSSNDLIEELAFLYSEGKNMKKSAYYFEKCGDMAKNNYFNYKALSFYDTALKIYDGIGEGLFRELNIANKKAMVLEIIGLWDESAELLEKSIKKAEKANENIIAELKCSHGLILIQQGQYDRAMDSLIHARDIGCKNNKSIYLTALKYIGNIYFDKGDYDKAMEYYNEGREFCKKSGDKQGYSNFIGGIGNIYWQIGDYDRAMDCFHEQKKICRELGDKRNYAQALGKIGGVYYNKGNNNMAMKYYNLSFTVKKVDKPLTSLIIDICMSV